MKVAAYQAPLLESGSMEAIELIRAQLETCEAEGVELLCCPEGILGGLADYADDPLRFALDVESGELETVLSPLASERVSLIIGFTESTEDGALFNSTAILHRGEVIGVYRKTNPAIRCSVYSAGDRLPVFRIGSLAFGILICNDANFPELARRLTTRGARALFIPLNNGLPPEKAMLTSDVRRLLTGLALDNSITVIAADVAGKREGLVCDGSTSIVARDGTLVRASQERVEDLLIADIEAIRASPENPNVALEMR